MKRNTVCAALALSAVAAFGGGNSCSDINLKLKGPVGKALDRMIENHLAATDVDYLTAPFSSHNERNNLWRTGDSLRVYLPMPVIAHVVDHHVAFTRGPVLLARDSRYGAGDLGEVIRDDIRDGQVMEGGLFVRSPSDAFRMTVTLPLGLGAHSENPEGLHSTQVKFCDYWSAGGEWRPENYYRTWFPLMQGPWQ